MIILVKLIGIIIAVMGIVFLTNPKSMKQYIAFWQQKKRLYIGGILSLLIGIIFLAAASECRLTGLIFALGILSLLKGIAILVLGPEKLSPVFKWWQGRPVQIARLAGIVALVFGALLIYV